MSDASGKWVAANEDGSILKCINITNGDKQQQTQPTQQTRTQMQIPPDIIRLIQSQKDELDQLKARVAKLEKAIQSISDSWVMS